MFIFTKIIMISTFFEAIIKSKSVKTEKPVRIINENAHSKIMREMAKYLDMCKEAKTNCQCSGVLKYNPDETNELKKWSFLYQCDENTNNNKVYRMEKLTTELLTEIENKKEETYQIKKKQIKDK